MNNLYATYEIILEVLQKIAADQRYRIAKKEYSGVVKNYT